MFIANVIVGTLGVLVCILWFATAMAEEHELRLQADRTTHERSEGRVMDWQPIETAPVGVPCLIFIPARSHGERRYPHVITTAVTEFQGQYGWLLCEAGSGAEDRDVWPYPTHWLPLPSPPQAEGGRDE